MSQPLIVTWDKHGGAVLQGTAGGGAVNITAAAAFDWPEGVSPAATPEQAGAFVRQQLQEAGIDASSAVVCLPREDAVFRHIEVPDIDDDQLPTIVRLQAATRSSVPVDELLVDFLPLSSLHNTNQRRILLATMSRRLSANITKMLKAAGLDAEGIGLGAIGASELALQIRKPVYGRATLVVNLSRNRLEVNLVQDQKLLQTHSAHLDADNLTAAAIRAEINRTTIATAQKLGDLSVGSVVAFCDADLTPMLSFLQDQYGDECEFVDPHSAPSVRWTDKARSAAAGFGIAAAGLLLNRSQGSMEGIDFLHPRKPVPKKDKRLLILGGAAAAALLIVGISWYSFVRYLHGLDEKAADLRTEADALSETVAAGKPTTDAAKELDTWEARHFIALKKLEQFEQALPGRDLAILNSYQLQVSAGSILGEYAVSGLASNRLDVRDAQARFDELGLRVPAAKPFGRSTREEKYPVAFEFVMDIPAASEKTSTAQRGQ